VATDVVMLAVVATVVIAVFATHNATVAASNHFIISQTI
jgi:hypothetical protein